MAKKSMLQREVKRKRIAKKQASKRTRLKAIANDKTISMEERFSATMDLAKLPADGSKVRQHNRCGLTGRPHGYYRKFNMSRIALRELASTGQIPGVIKSSW